MNNNENITVAFSKQEIDLINKECIELGFDKDAYFKYCCLLGIFQDNTYDINSLEIMNGEEDVTENYMFHEFEYGFLLVKYPEISYGKVKANASGSLYLRTASFGNYSLSLNSEGKLWTAATPYTGGVSGPNGFTAEALSKTFDDIYSVEFSNMKTYMLPYYSYATDSNKTSITTDTDYSVIDCSKPYSVQFYKVPNIFDRLLAVKKNAIPSEEEQAYRQYVYDNYLFVDSLTLEYMQSIIKRESFSASDEDIVKRVAVYIQNSAKYELYYDSALDSEENIVIAFLDEYKVGNCTHYASAATLLFRAIGIPARYVEGFFVEATEGVDVDITNPPHAWVEVYLDGIGWVYVEVTGGMKNGFDTGLYEGEKLPTGFTVQPLAYKHKFTGSAFYAENKIEEFGDLKKLIERGYTYTVEVSGSRQEIGSSATTVTSFILYDPNGNNVTDDFDIEYLNGEIEVCENPISIYLYEIRKYYDAKDIVIGENGYKIMTPLAAGITLELDFHINLKNVGEITRSELNLNTAEYVTYKVYLNGTDVTRGYTLYFDIHESITDTAGYIPISIKPRQIEVASGTAVKIFDGTPLTSDEFNISIGSLVEGDTISVMIDGEQIKIGRSENKIVSATVIDKDGNNVTDNYKIVPKSGILTVLDPASY
jgi:transglutaminase-like putative cysteine protease